MNKKQKKTNLNDQFNINKNAWASGDFVPSPDPQPGLCLWTPMGTFVTVRRRVEGWGEHPLSWSL